MYYFLVLFGIALLAASVCCSYLSGIAIANWVPGRMTAENRMQLTVAWFFVTVVIITFIRCTIA